MRGRTAHIKVANRRAVLRPSRHRAQKEQLLQREFALKDVAFRQAELALDVQWREHLTMNNDVAQIRRVFRDGIDHRIAELFALLVPVPFF